MTQVNKKLPITPKQAARQRNPLDRFLDPMLFKAFGDPTRSSILACLAKCGRACSVSEIAECCAVDLSVVSRHLSLLARSGVLDVSKAGRTVYYRVRYSQLCSWLRGLAEALETCCPEAKVVAGTSRDDCVPDPGRQGLCGGPSRKIDELRGAE